MDVIVLDWVELVITVDVSTFSHGFWTQIVRVTATVVVCRALPYRVFFLGPVGLESVVKEHLFCAPAEVVMMANKEVHPDNGENGENESLEYADIEETWDRSKEGL